MTTEFKTVQPVPNGYHTVTPWIIVRGATQLLDYLKEAFGAKEIVRFYNEDGAIGHAEVRIGDSVLMMFDAKEGWPTTPSFIRLYVEDGNAVYHRALEAGGSSVTEMTELFFGDRVGRVCDPAGNIWWIQTQIEDVAPEEMAKRVNEQTYIDAMRQVQESLDRELSSRNHKPAGAVTPEALLKHWQGHRRLTRRVIESFPEDQLFSFSVGSMRPFGSVAMEMINMAVPMVRGVVTGEWERFVTREIRTREEILRLWDESTEQIDALWPQVSSARFHETITAFGQYEGLVYELLLYVIDNEIHHRGQGYVYLRALEIEPPPFYERH